MNAIIITRQGSVFSYPYFRPLGVNMDKITEALQNAVQFSPKIRPIKLGKNIFGIYLQDTFFFVTRYPAKQTFYAKFYTGVKPEKNEDGQTNQFISLAPAPLHIGNANRGAIRTLPYILPWNLWVIYESGLSKNPDFEFLDTSKIYAHAFMLDDENTVLSCLMPNTLHGGSVCMGAFDVDNVHDVLQFAKGYEQTVFDSVNTMYPVATFNNFWRWRLDPPSSGSDQQESVTFIGKTPSQRLKFAFDNEKLNTVVQYLQLNSKL